MTADVHQGVNTRRHMTVRDFPSLKDENGGRLCRWCRQPVTPPRRTMCSAECVHEMELRTNKNYLRSQVLKRDKGVCALCGFDAEKMKRILDHAVTAYCKTNGIQFRAWHHFMIAAIGLLVRLDWRIGKSNWEADHILPVSEGGGGCGLENLRTLCIPCHKEVTREMYRRRKRRRKGLPSPSALIRACERGRR